MRVVSTISDGAQFEHFNVVPPCAGYYTNMCFMIYLPVFSGNVEDEMEAWVMISKGLDAVYQDGSIFPDVTGDQALVSNYKGNGLFKAFSNQVSIAHPVVANMFFYSWGKKRISVQERDILNVTYFSGAVETNAMMLIQGEFIPYKGALFKQRYQLPDISDGDDWSSANKWVCPVSLKNLQIKVEIVYTYIDAVSSMMIMFRVHKAGQDTVADTVSDGAGDILDADFVEQDNFSMAGVVGEISIATAAGTSRVPNFTGILNVGQMNEGDFITWDADDIAGAQTNNVIHVNFIVAGVIAKQYYSKEGFFVQSDKIINLNKIQDVFG